MGWGLSWNSASHPELFHSLILISSDLLILFVTQLLHLYNGDNDLPHNQGFDELMHKALRTVTWRQVSTRGELSGITVQERMVSLGMTEYSSVQTPSGQRALGEELLKWVR